MGQIRVTTDMTPVENLEFNLLPSSARTTAQSVDFVNSAGKDLLIMLDVTAVTAAVAGVAEVASLSVTDAPTVAGNVTITLNGVGQNVAVDPATEIDATTLATKIRSQSYAGWTTGGSGTTVTFTATSTGTRTDATWSAGTTGAVATMTTPTQGVTAVSASGITLTVSGRTPTGNKAYTLLTGAQISATGTYVYVISKNAGAASGGITATADTPIPKSLRVSIAVANANSCTYSVDAAICQ